jgi:hypothetical protein
MKGAVMDNRKQLTVFLILLVVYALCAFATYAFFADQLADSMGIPLPDMGVPNWVVGLANAGIVLVVYGLLGLAGFWFARKLDLPGIFSVDGNPRRWFLVPLLFGLVCGVIIVLGDSPLHPSTTSAGFHIHPFQFPSLPPSVRASAKRSCSVDLSSACGDSSLTGCSNASTGGRLPCGSPTLSPPWHLAQGISGRSSS